MKARKISTILWGLILAASLPVNALAAMGLGGPGGGGPDGGLGGAPGGGLGGPGEPGAGAEYYSVSSAPITVNEGKTYTVTLAASDSNTWSVANNTDVTGWFVQKDGSAAFIAKTGAASVSVSGDKKTATVSLNAAKIGGTKFNGTFDLYVTPAAGSISGDAKPASKQVGSVQIPKLEVPKGEEVYGSGYEPGKNSTADFFFSRGATLTVSGVPGLDDSKIDSSKAVVSIGAGDNYYEGDFILKNTAVKGTWKNGKLVYALTGDDLHFNTEGDDRLVEGGTLSFTAGSGDGYGNNYINLTVSGVTYNGVPLAEATIPVHIYVYGRSGGDLANLNFQTLFPTWKAENDGTEDPLILCDPYEDDIVIKWPNAVNASKLTAEDITIALKGDYAALTLKPGTDYVLNTNAAGKTEIGVRYQQWAYVPVYHTMTITVDPSALAYDSYYKLTGLEQSYDVATVYAYSLQDGGVMGGDEGVTTYTYYGVTLDSWQQVQISAIYRLQTADGQYYAEKDGTGSLTKNVDEAKTFDGSGPEDYNFQLIRNHIVVYTTLNSGKYKVTKTVGGKPVEFTKQYGAGTRSEAVGMILGNAAGNSINPISTEGIRLLPGYTFGANPFNEDMSRYNWLATQYWPWMGSFNLGWVGPWTQKDDTPAVTREMVAYALWQVSGMPGVEGSSKFSDISDDRWSADAVIWAVSKGIISGSGGTFKPEDNVTLQDLATMVWRSAGQPKAEAQGFSDASAIAGYAVNALNWLEHSLSTGNTVDKGEAPTLTVDGAIKPTRTVSAAQLAEIIYYAMPHGAMGAH